MPPGIQAMGWHDCVCASPSAGYLTLALPYTRPRRRRASHEQRTRGTSAVSLANDDQATAALVPLHLPGADAGAGKGVAKGASYGVAPGVRGAQHKELAASHELKADRQRLLARTQWDSGRSYGGGSNAVC